MNIILVSNHIFHYRIHVYNALDKYFRNDGHSFRVVANSIDDNQDRIFKYDQVSFHSPKLLRKVLSPKPDVVILFLHLKDIVGFFLVPFLHLKGIPVVYWNHGVNLLTPDSRIKKPFFNFFHKRCDSILLYSDNERRCIAKKYHGKVFVAPNTLNFDSFPHVEETKEQLKERYGLKDEKIVLMVTRIRPIKRLDDLLKASEQFDDGISVVVVGGGATSEQEQAMRENPRIHYWGPVYDSRKISEIFKMSDVFCIPGLVGLSLNQAFYWGLPLITEDVIHSPEICYLENGINGYIVPRGDIAALAERINTLMSDPDMLSAFSTAARSKIHTDASMEAMAEGFLTALRHAVRG